MKNILLDVIKNLSKSKIEFVICSGVACILQGCDRSTYDLDISISFSDDNLKSAINVFKKMKFVPRIPEPFEALLDADRRKIWIKEKNAIVYTIISEKGDIQIDLFLDYCIDHDELKKNADIYDIEGYEVFVTSKKDLIKAKKSVNPIRDKDEYDIRQLEEIIAGEQKKD